MQSRARVCSGVATISKGTRHAEEEYVLYWLLFSYHVGIADGLDLVDGEETRAVVHDRVQVIQHSHYFHGSHLQDKKKG